MSTTQLLYRSTAALQIPRWRWHRNQPSVTMSPDSMRTGAATVCHHCGKLAAMLQAQDDLLVSSRSFRASAEAATVATSRAFFDRPKSATEPLNTRLLRLPSRRPSCELPRKMHAAQQLGATYKPIHELVKLCQGSLLSDSLQRPHTGLWQGSSYGTVVTGQGRTCGAGPPWEKYPPIKSRSWTTIQCPGDRELASPPLT